RLDRALLGAALGGAADVEGAHGELGARLADRLRGDNANRLADIDRRSAREVAAVALAADTRLGLAGQHRADLHHVDAGALDLVPQRLVDELRRLDDDLAGERVLHVLGRGTAKDAVG